MITKIKWKNHPILHNLELDFLKDDGNVYDTIVIAGENGVGKTSILETLQAFLNLLGGIDCFEYIEYRINEIDYRIIPAESGANLGFHIRNNLKDNTTEQIRSNKNNNFERLKSDPADLRSYGCVYSKSRSGFKTNQIQSITNQQVDSDKYESDSSEDFTKIKQLLVDLSQQDNNLYARINQTRQLSYDDFYRQSKTYRFKQSFNEFFDALKYDGIDDDNGINISFSKNGHKIFIDQLSTGEKQIVFRGSHLLKNSRNINGGTVLIDEPELSLHPKWQEKILSYYRKLFTDENGKQTSQLFVATHSEYVIKNALQNSDNCLVITIKEDNDQILSSTFKTPILLPTINLGEILYKAFNIITTDFHIALYGQIQYKSQSTNILDCDTYIYNSPFFNSTKHLKSDPIKPQYRTLPTFIRNTIDHPDSNRIYSQEELKTSIELMIQILT